MLLHHWLIREEPRAIVPGRGIPLVTTDLAPLRRGLYRRPPAAATQRCRRARGCRHDRGKHAPDLSGWPQSRLSRLYFATDGRIGPLMNLIRVAGSWALEADRLITRELLADAFELSAAPTTRSRPRPIASTCWPSLTSN